MKSFIRDLIEYHIQSDELPSSIENYSTFCLNDYLEFNPENVSIQQISKVTIVPKLQSFYNLKENITIYNDMVSDCDYLYEFTINWRIEYVDSIENVIFSCKGESILSSHIKLKSSLLLSNKIVPNIFIDDVYIELLSPKSCLLNFTGMVLIED